MTNQAATPASATAAAEDPFQNQRLIVLLIPRAVHQGDGVLFALLLQQLEGVLLLSAFLPVTSINSKKNRRDGKPEGPPSRRLTLLTSPPKTAGLLFI